MHNCPWNDWNPPSKSSLLFEQAAANWVPSSFDQRVRAHVSVAVDEASKTLLAFAFIENNGRGNMSLVIRRGAGVLTSMAVSTVQAQIVGQRKVVLSITPDTGPSPSLYLTFEDDTRLVKFCNMIIASGACQ